MGHFENLRCKNHKGLREATLRDLGRINVLCGPNNSGKTTVLECILDKARHCNGKRLNGDAILRIHNGSMNGRSWNSPHYARIYEDALDESFRRSELWFDSDLGDLWATVYNICQSNRLGPLRMAEEFNKSYLAEFPTHPSVVMIPAKRRLDSTVKVKSSERITPDGQGVLNYLFAAKNQDEMSAQRKSFNQIATGFQSITGGYDFDVFLAADNEIELRFKWPKANWVPADDCGLGLRDLLIMLYFGTASEYEVVLIEEPENHLHPEIQRRLIKFLKEHSDKQFFISTHSSVFLNTLFADRVFTCRLADGVQVENATNRAAMLAELGYSISDNLVSDLVVLCEGPKDKPVLEEFFLKMGLPQRFNIKVWPLGGDIMDQLDLTVFGESYHVIALLDNDPGSAKIRKNFLRKCSELCIPAHQLKRYALENYFSVPAIASVMADQMPADVTALDPNKRIADQLGFEVKRNGGRIAKAMSLDDIAGTDLEGFLEQVEQLASSRK